MDLIADDELQSTIEAALAFIDECTEAGDERAGDLLATLTARQPNGGATSDAFDPNRSQCSDASADPEVLGPALQQKRTRNAVASSRSRKKRQTELLVLREEESVLRDRLRAVAEWKLTRGQLAVGSRRASASLLAAPSYSHCQIDASEAAELAERAHRERQRAEALNRRLRAALRKQRSVTQHLSQLVQKRLELKVRQLKA